MIGQHIYVFAYHTYPWKEAGVPFRKPASPGEKRMEKREKVIIYSHDKDLSPHR